MTRSGETHELGVIRLQDDSGRDPGRARQIARERLAESALLKRKPGGQFCAIGGTWRSLAKMHQVLRDYPLHMVQHYTAKASDLAKLCDEIVEAAADGKALPAGEHVSSSRRDLMPFGAAVLGEVLRAGQVRKRGVLRARRPRRLSSTASWAPEEQADRPAAPGG